MLGERTRSLHPHPTPSTLLLPRLNRPAMFSTAPTVIAASTMRVLAATAETARYRRRSKKMLRVLIGGHLESRSFLAALEQLVLSQEVLLLLRLALVLLREVVVFLLQGFLVEVHGW